MGTSRPRTQDFFPAPALSLSLAGAFARNAPEAPGVEEEGDVGSGGIGGGLRLGDAAEISSETTGPGGSHSGGGSGEEGDGGDQKRRKSYHRHTAEQIRVMETMFKEFPHPDDTQRQQLSRQLGLSARQVKFWFQNRRTQIKAIQERQENSLLKYELEKLQEENRAMRELVTKSSNCPSCGVPSSSNTSAATTEEQVLRLENARLKAEVEALRGTPGMSPAADALASPSPMTSPSCAVQQINGPCSLDEYVGSGSLLGHDEARILELARSALDELTAMCSAGEPLWVRSVETGRDVLNHDEYLRLFPREEDSGSLRNGWSVEASRETGVVYLDTARLVEAFMDANQWKELFPSMVSKASTLSVIQAGENDDQDGAVQLMFAEVQMLTPVVPTREFRFVRYCKKLAAEKWAAVDVSLDKIEPDARTTSSSTACRCLKKPSGCVIEEQSNGHCKVTWVEHTTCRDVAVPSMYWAATASGLAFGARRWVATLQLQCERMVFSVATNVPMRDSTGVSTPAGRRSVLKLAHRMTSSLCRSIGASRGVAWIKAPNAGRGDVWVMSRKNRADPGEPQGLIACAVLSTWLPVSPAALVDFLRDGTRRNEWDATLPGRSVESRVNVTKGKDRANCVTIYAAAEDRHAGKWILQDSCTGPCESVLAYAPVDAGILRPVIDGHDCSNVALLPCGFAVAPDGLGARAAVITSSKTEDGNRAAGSLVTVAFQTLVTTGASSTTIGDALPPDSVATVTGLVACTLGNIKKALRCEDC